jgi:hypothetical protein
MFQVRFCFAELCTIPDMPITFRGVLIRSNRRRPFILSIHSFFLLFSDLGAWCSPATFLLMQFMFVGDVRVVVLWWLGAGFLGDFMVVMGWCFQGDEGELMCRLGW